MKVRSVRIGPEGAGLDRLVGGGCEAHELRANLLRFARLVGDFETHPAGGGR